jgi:hypothetical protein
VSASDKPFTVACHVGRLVEIRIGAFTSRDQFAQVQAEAGDLLSRIEQPILCVDARGGRLVSEELAEAALSVMRYDNPLFFRSAILAASPMLFMQTARLSREANNIRRKTFDTAGQLLLWLRPDLTDAEFERLQSFLSEPPSLSADVAAGEPLETPSDQGSG